MSTLFGRIFKAPSVYADRPQSAESPAASGTGGEDIRLDRAEDMDMVRAFIAVLLDELETARDTIRELSPRDRALLSFTLEEVTRLVSEEEDFRRTADRRLARADMERNGDIVRGHLRDI
jgi:hypothetical protein